MSWRDALVGPAATTGVFLLLLIISIAPAGWMGRRALLSTGRQRANRLTAVVTALSLVVARPASVRALFRFAIRSIFTSRRHLLLLSTRFGLATALSLLGLMMLNASEGLVFDRLRGYWLSPPLILIYLTVIGLKSCLAIPSDLDANWIFRLLEPPVGAVRRASRLVLLVVGVAPIVLVFAIVSLSIWQSVGALRAIALITTTAVVIVELVLWGWTHVPFATAHPPNPNAIKSGWPRHVAALIATGLILPAAFVGLSRSTRGTLIYLSIVTTVTVAVRWRNERELRLSPASFEAGEPEALTLQLSEAGH